MKRVNIIFLMLLFVFVFTLTGCDFLGDIFEDISNSDGEKYDHEFESSTGCWKLSGDEDTYFIFDGSKGVMSLRYIEDGNPKYSGTYRAIYRGIGKNVLTPLAILITRSDKEKEDWLSCYVEDFHEDFTQFTIMAEEEDLGMISGSFYTHIYRISELPYKMGTYVLEDKDYKEESNNYRDADSLYIPNGTYALETGERFTFLMTKPMSRELFQYKNGDVVVEGTFFMASDRKTIYLYIEHDPYSKVTNADKDEYDTTFDIYYPPDFYLRGDFSNSDSIIINDLYHHSESPTEIQDSTWKYGTYVKQSSAN